MATSDHTVAFLLEQLSAVQSLSIRKMFGEYGIWVDGKTVGLICDDQLFIKPTDAGKALADGAQMAPPYPGAKPSMLIDPERWDEADWLMELVRVTAAALPAPRPKNSKSKAKAN